MVVLEGHTNAAAVYVCGVLSVEAALRAEALSLALIHEISVLRLDLRGVVRVEEGSLSIIVRTLVHWRMERRAHSHIVFPLRRAADDVDTSLARLRCLGPSQGRDSCGTLHA